jgi:hypothetical protein
VWKIALLSNWVHILGASFMLVLRRAHTHDACVPGEMR